jgi:hypothetical protein
VLARRGLRRGIAPLRVLQLLVDDRGSAEDVHDALISPVR